MDTTGSLSQTAPQPYKGVTSDGTTLIFGDGAPFTIGGDGNLYHGSNGSQEESFPTGAMTVAKLSSGGRRSLFAPSLKPKLAELKDGITGLAAGPDESIYIATWNGIVKLSNDGSIASVMHPIKVTDCDSDPADPRQL